MATVSWLATIATLACSSPPAAEQPTPLVHRAAPTAPAPAPDATAEVQRARFVGRAIGYRLGHGAQPSAGRIELPPGMTLQSSASFADGHRLAVASEGTQLVILLTDERGVVLDDVGLPGMADAAVALDCEGESLIGVLTHEECPTADRLGEARFGFAFHTGQLVSASTPTRCDCMFAHDIDPP